MGDGKETMNQVKGNVATKFEIFQYGFGGIGINATYCMIMTFLMFFLTDIAGISAGIAGSIFLIVTIFDAINDPIIGGIADRTETKRGKYRPYLLFGTPVLAGAVILLFSVPNISMTAKVIYYFAAYCLYSVSNTSVVAPYMALTPCMSDDANQRNYIVMAKQYLGIAGFFVVNAITLPLVDKLGGGESAWQTVMLIYSVPIIISMWIAANGAKRHDVGNINKQKKKIKVKDQIRVISNNKAVIVLFVATGIMYMGTQVARGANVYFCKLVLGDANYVTKFAMITLAINVIIVPIVPFLIGKIGKKKLLVTAMLISIVRPLIFLIFKPFSSAFILLGLTAFSSAGGIVGNVALWAMIPDCIEFGEWKTGIKGAGLISAGFTFAQKCCISVGGLILGITLQVIGYASGQTPTPEVINGILYISTLIPIGGLAAMIIGMKFYPITKEILEKVMKENRMRKEEESIIAKSVS